MTHWAITHAALFGNKSSEWEETYIAWNDLFAAEGFTKAQLEAATIAVAKRFKVPVFASEHLNALREELRDIRKMDYERALRAARTMSPSAISMFCAPCFSTLMNFLNSYTIPKSPIYCSLRWSKKHQKLWAP